MVDPRRRLDTLIAAPARFNADTTLRDGVKAQYGHLERLGLSEQDLISYPVVLGRELAQASR